MRYFIQLSYNGTNYAGWQIQPNAPSVQQTLNDVLSKLTRQEIYVVGAGRTDAGVHARKMVAHFDAAEELNTEEITFRANRFLPDDIAIQRIFKVPDDAHARFDATSRSYEYWVSLEKDPFLTNSAWLITHKLDVDAMNEAAQKMLGEKDFGAFARSGAQTKTNMCHVTHANWQFQDGLLIFNITANRFLRNMVRAVVGTLIDVGQNKISVQRFEEVLQLKDRKLAGESAPAHALYLTEIVYPTEILEYGPS